MQVFYRPEQSVFVKSSSPSAGKPAQVVEHWRGRFGASLEFTSFEPVTREDFYRVHDRAYVDGVFTLERPNGFGTRQAEVVEQLLIGLLAGGHCLLEGVPGLGKTLLVRTLGQALDLRFRRVQFTPDLMPSDILGTEILEEDHGTGHRHFKFQPGPVFTNLLLADELNRTPPKTQAALLEAMQEKTVSYAGVTHELPAPFFVLATQNPIEQAGTYPLPEAQLDRFLLHVRVDYPTEQEERDILLQTTGSASGSVPKVMDADVMKVPVDERGRTSGVAMKQLIDALSDIDKSRVCAVVATSGTTNVGVVDDLQGIGEQARRLGAWFHVDGAYGAAALCAPSVRHLFNGIEQCDSLIVDPHKWLFGPYDSCALLYRNPEIARQAHTQHAEYLDVLQQEGDKRPDEAMNPADLAHHLSRRARGLPVWFSLAMHGPNCQHSAALRFSLWVGPAAAVGPPAGQPGGGRIGHGRTHR